MYNQWLYLLIDKQSGNYIYLDASNNIQYTATPTALAYTPDGWQKKSIAWERDLDKFGLVRTFTVSLNYVVDGKTLLDKIALQQTFDVSIQLLIQKLNFNTGSNAFEYIDFYIGELSLSQLESDEVKVSLPVTEGGIAKQLKANIDTIYEIDPNEVSVNMDGIVLHESAKLLVADGVDISIINYSSNFTLPVAFINADGQASGIAFFDQQIESNLYAGGWNNRLIDTNFLGEAATINTGTINARIRGTLIVKCTAKTATNVTVGFRFIRSGQLSANQNDYRITGIAQPNVGQTYTIPFDVTVPLIPGETIFFEGVWNLIAGTDCTIQFQDGSTFTVEFQNRYLATTASTKSVWTVFQDLVEKITGDRTNAVSTLLQANTNIVLTCGDAIRGLTGSKIKTSLSEFFKFCKVVFCAGMGIENGKIVIESASHFFDVSTPINLGTCKGFKWKFAEEFLFNSLQIGYVVKDLSNTDNVNGKYSFNNSQTYTTQITSVSKKLELLCPYVADPYYIEIIRINFDGKTTTDNNSDNEVMILNIAGTDLKRETYVNTDTGVPDIDSLFNIVYLTPKQILKRWMPYINSCLFQFQGSDLMFETTEKNRDLKTDNGSVVIDEDADEIIGGTRIFKAIYYNFETTVDDVVPNTLTTNPNKGFTTTNPLNGKDFTGILIKGAMAANEETPQSFRLLASPDDDENNLLL